MSDGLHIAVVGNGPPLVLLHGWAMHGGVFATLAQRLRERHTLYIVDLPGHGLSRGDTTPLAFDAVCDALFARVPSLWIAGRRDRLVDPRAMREAATAIERAGHASAEFIQIEHAGHAPFLTHVDEILAPLNAFLDESAAIETVPPSFIATQ